VARDRQRAKQRQAERRARRQAGQPDTPPAAPGIDDPRAVDPLPGILPPNLAVGAPPVEEGRSDFAGRDEPDLELEDDDPELEADAIEAGALASVDDPEAGEADGHTPKGRRGDSSAAGQAKDRSRVVQFVLASWAELQRVQWPDRQALTTLTGVVLGFVLIMGGYLGLLDAVFSRIVNAIL
jgi:preprotein translocase subunit SecE